MSHNFWSIVLIVCGAQCLFLLSTFLVKPIANKKASLLMLVLLAIILCTTVSNIWSSTYLYRTIPQIAGFARGMVLLLGPLLYFYVLSIVKQDFRLRPVQLLHFIPYLVALLVIRTGSADSNKVIIENIDKLMEGRANIEWTSALWFVIYSIHLFVYIIMTRYEMIHSIQNASNFYLVPVEERIGWIKRIAVIFVIIALVFVGHSISILLTGVVGIITNYIYNVVLAAMVYLVAFQAIYNNKLLSPDFTVKYKSTKINDQLKDSIAKSLLQLFEQDKIFMEADLTLTLVAEKMNVHPNIISQVINNKFNKTFSELLNHYRIEEFKIKVHEPGFDNYSIIGIAYDVGYNSKSSFNTAFKKQTGITPSEYIKSLG